eukprot:6194842-Pleurochrysis_carterae.AAC.1
MVRTRFCRYELDLALPHVVEDLKAKAKYDKKTRVLSVTLPRLAFALADKGASCAEERAEGGKGEEERETAAVPSAARAGVPGLHADGVEKEAV